VKDPSIADRVNKTVKIAEERLVEAPPYPKAIKIELTGRCDLKCSFCSLTTKAREKGDIDPQLVFKIIDDAAAINVQEIGLFWLGEPILNARLPEYIRYAKGRGIPMVFITTNARMATAERLQAIYDAGVDSVKFSFNAPDRDIYKEVTGVDAFDQVLANIKMAHEIRGSSKVPSLSASTVYNPDKPEDFERAKAAVLPFIDEHYPLRQYGPEASKREGARTLADMLPCWSLFSLPHISYSGHMSACFCDHDSKFFVGDLKEMTLAEAWHSERFKELRRAHLKRDVAGLPCADCIAYQ
jgi:MoaA/NifB/PqqE/SkfB family radical SAM enzyme